MSSSGYSGTPLIKKLGFVPGDTLYVEDTPSWYSDMMTENAVELTPNLPATTLMYFVIPKQHFSIF